MTWKHEELAEDLAIAKRTGYLDTPLGSVWLEKAQRADVVLVNPSYTRFCISVFEVKVSRSDFQSDIRSDKWKGYLNHCHRFYFAAPKGMLKKEEIPRPAGLIERSDKGWRVALQPQKLDTVIPETTYQSMLFNRQKQDSRVRRRENLFKDASIDIDSKEARVRLKKIGNHVSEAINSIERHENAKLRYDCNCQTIENVAGEVLGVEPKVSVNNVWKILRDIDLESHCRAKHYILENEDLRKLYRENKSFKEKIDQKFNDKTPLLRLMTEMVAEKYKEEENKNASDKSK